ncbi:MAG: ABC transporter permease [Bacilli bacterium]|nr:ABC transporter permease [Bacilli bacterium]
MKKKNKSKEELLFQTIDNNDPRLADTVDVSEVIDTNIEDLFTVVGTSDERIEKLDSTPYSYWRLTFKFLFKNPLVILCLVVLGILIFFTIFGPMMRYYPIFEKVGAGFEPINRWKEVMGPNAEHWFGIFYPTTSNVFNGTDLWYIVWKGAQLSLILGAVVALIDTIAGIVIGSLWGYFRWLDPILIEFRNFVNNIPTLLLDILLMQILKPSFWVIVFLLCALGWIGLAGFIRNQIIIIRNREYNIASQTLGSSSTTMITHNLLPYLVSVIITVVSTAIPEAISAEVGLSYFNLSFNASNNQITLGQVLTTVCKSLSWMEHPYLLIAPMMVMAPLTITFFYLGLALADATDPKSHR